MSAGGCLLSVAVVTNRSVDLRSLQGLRSCHSGLRWTAGWSLPLGFLLSRNYLSWSKEQPLSHGNVLTIYGCSPFTFFRFISLLHVAVCCRRQCLLQCQLRPRRCSSGAAALRFVPRPEVLHPAEEPPLRDVPQRALLRQPGGPQVRLPRTPRSTVAFRVKLWSSFSLSFSLSDRCLRSSAGDVAFVDHLALDSIEGKLSHHH